MIGDDPLQQEFERLVYGTLCKTTYTMFNGGYLWGWQHPLEYTGKNRDDDEIRKEDNGTWSIKPDYYDNWIENIPSRSLALDLLDAFDTVVENVRDAWCDSYDSHDYDC